MADEVALERPRRARRRSWGRPRDTERRSPRRSGTAHFRPAGYFAIGNLGAACIAVGPATVLGLSRLRNRRLWLLVGAGALCVVVADASQYSKAEVERIWLLFYPWLVLAAVALGRPRRWLGAQAALAIGLQVALVSKW